MTSNYKYSFPTPNQMNPMLPSVIHHIHLPLLLHHHYLHYNLLSRVGSLLSLSNLASGLSRMDSSGLFLPTVHRANSIPQVANTPNITHNSHFVPYGDATGYFEPPTPSQNDATQTPTITTPTLATNNNSSGPYAQFQYMNIQQQQNKLKQIDNKPQQNLQHLHNQNMSAPSQSMLR